MNHPSSFSQMRTHCSIPQLASSDVLQQRSIFICIVSDSSAVSAMNYANFSGPRHKCDEVHKLPTQRKRGTVPESALSAFS